jgi:hypothetical protein
MKNTLKLLLLFVICSTVPFLLIGSMSGFEFNVTKWEYGQTTLLVLSSAILMILGGIFDNQDKFKL